MSGGVRIPNTEGHRYSNRVDAGVNATQSLYNRTNDATIEQALSEINVVQARVPRPPGAEGRLQAVLIPLHELVTGRTIGEEAAAVVETAGQDVVRPIESPIKPTGWRLAAESAMILALVAYAGWSLQILWGI